MLNTKIECAPIFLNRNQSSSLNGIPLFLNVHCTTFRSDTSEDVYQIGHDDTEHTYRSRTEIREQRFINSLLLIIQVSSSLEADLDRRRLSVIRVLKEFPEYCNRPYVKGISKENASTRSLTSELARVAREYLVDQCTLVDFDRFIPSG